MENTGMIEIDKFQKMFYKSDELSDNNLFVTQNREVKRKDLEPDYDKDDDNFMSLREYINCTLDVNAYDVEKKSGVLNLEDPYHFQLNEVISKINDLYPQTKEVFSEFWNEINYIRNKKEENVGMEHRYLYEMDFDELSNKTIEDIFEYFDNNIVLFKELYNQMGGGNLKDFFQELDNIYQHGANQGTYGLIYNSDMEKFFDNNSDEMYDWLDEEANSLGYDSKMSFIAECGAGKTDLEDYKVWAVQAFAENIAYRVMEANTEDMDIELTCRSEEEEQNNFNEIMSLLTPENQQFFTGLFEDNEKAKDITIEALEQTKLAYDGDCTMIISAELDDGYVIRESFDLVNKDGNNFLNEMRRIIKEYGSNESDISMTEPSFYDGEKGVSFFLQIKTIDELRQISGIETQEQNDKTQVSQRKQR